MHIVQKLISIPSQSGDEGEIQAFIFEYLSELGFLPFYQEGNVVVKIVGTDSSKALLFDAHVDTVSTGDLSLWSSDPFAGKRTGDVVYGLGASDNKASVASLLLLALHYSHRKPDVDVFLVFVVGEEVDGSGSKSFVEWFVSQQFDYGDVWAVVTEPTEMARVEVGHRGNIFVKIIAQGKSGHGSRPLVLDDNAVLVMSQTALKLHALNEVWRTQLADDLFGPPTIGVGTSIMAGSQAVPNKFADTCTMTVDVRTTPSTHDKIMGLVQQSLAGLSLEVSLARDPAPCGFTQEDHPLVRVVEAVLPSVDVVVSPWSTDQCFFSEKGFPAVVIGPGVSRVIHQANEYCLVSLIDESVRIFAQLVRKMSGVPGKKKLQ